MLHYVRAKEVKVRAPRCLPARRVESVLSEYVLADNCGFEVAVPNMAIFRNHESVKTLAPPLDYDREQEDGLSGLCLGCSNEDCCAGWPEVNRHMPARIKVLGTRFQDGTVHFGWYVHITSKHWGGKKRLYRLPRMVMAKTVKWLSKRAEWCESSLLTEYPEAWDTMHHAEAADFHIYLMDRFARVAHNLANHIAEHRGGRARAYNGERTQRLLSLRSRTMGPVLTIGKQRGRILKGSPARNSNETLEMCGVCLEDGGSVKSCCGIAVCEDCNENMRDMCPVCDRSKLNLFYECASCTKTVTLQKFGFPCGGCAQNVLCEKCYQSFGECETCDGT